MKKTFISLAVAAVMAFGFTSCGEIDLPVDFLGSFNLTATDVVNPGTSTQYFTEGNMTSSFGSAIGNAHADTTFDENHNVVATSCGTIIVCTSENLVTTEAGENIEITFPLLAMNLRDTVARTFNFNFPTEDFSFVEDLKDLPISQMILQGVPYADQVCDLFALAVSETEFYLAYNGTFTITEYGSNGHMIKGTANNLKCFYLTEANFQAVQDAHQNGSTESLEAILPHVTLNGNLECRRAPMETILNAIEDLED